MGQTEPTATDRGKGRDKETTGEEEILGFLQPHFEPATFPWRQIGGYLLSLALTLVALYLVMHHVLPAASLLVVILALAAVQAAVQLGFFMHLRESTGPAWHIVSLALGVGIALGIVAFSIWILSFKWGGL